MHNNTSPPYRSLERWSSYDSFSYSLDDFLVLKELPEKEFILTILYGERYIDLNVRLTKKQPVVFFFHGAVERVEGFKAPVFSGFNAVKESFSRVLVSDSCLLESGDLTLGWYGGSKALPLQKILPSLFQKLIELLNPPKVIFAGGSGGGFAALYYSSFFDDSIAVTSNPQTDILSYYKNHVRRYADIGFSSTPEELSNFVEVDLKGVYKKDRKNYVFYIQNAKDDFHVRKHCLPFFKEFDNDFKMEMHKLVGNDFYFISPNWGNGHVGPPAVFWNEIIAIIASADKTEQLFCSAEFTSDINKLLLDYQDDLVLRSKLYCKSKKIEKAQKTIEHYFDIARKPSADAFLVAFDIYYSAKNMNKLKECFIYSQRIYPKGWVLKYRYALCLDEAGEADEALSLLLVIQEQLGVRLPEKIANKINIIQAISN